MSWLVNLFYIYDPWFFHFFRMAFFVGGIALVILAYQFYQKTRDSHFYFPKNSIITIMLLILISIIPLATNLSRDFSVVIMYVKTLLLFGFGMAIYALCYQSQPQKFIRDLKIGIIIQAIIGFLALAGVIWAIDLGLFSKVIMPRFYGSEQEYRLYNITSSAFFQLSIFYLMLLHFLLAYNEKHNTMSSIYLFLLLFIGLISGRTFLMLSIVSILLYFKWRYIPVLVIFISIILFLAINYPDNRYVAHCLEPVINLIFGKGQISSSTDNLVHNHLYLPSLKQMLIGDGRYYLADGRYYGHTDSGFIRQLLYGGFLYLASCFLFMVYFVWQIALNWFDGSKKFIVSTLLLLTILHIKADTYAFPGIMLVFLMFLSLFSKSEKNNVADKD